MCCYVYQRDSFKANLHQHTYLVTMCIYAVSMHYRLLSISLALQCKISIKGCSCLPGLLIHVAAVVAAVAVVVVATVVGVGVVVGVAPAQHHKYQEHQ